MSVFETKKNTSSVQIAKDRLKVLLVSDRIDCTPDAYEKLSHDLYQTISKYIEVEKHRFSVQMTRSHIYITLTGENS